MHKRAFLIGAAISSTLAVRAAADTFTWDADPDTPGVQDGPGAWNTTALNWFDGTQNVAWPGEGHFARFAGAGGAVITVALSINVGQIAFLAPGYRLTGGSIVLDGTLANRIIRTTADAVIESDLAVDSPGASWAKAGPGALSFRGGAIAPHFQVGAGELNLISRPTGFNGLIIQGGATFRWSNPTQPLSLGNSLITGAGGGTVRVDAGTVEISALSKDSGPLHIAGNGLVRILRITADSATAPTTISSGTVELGDNGALGSVINLEGGTLCLAQTSGPGGPRQYGLVVNAGTGGGTLTKLGGDHAVAAVNIPAGTSLTASGAPGSSYGVGAKSLTLDGTLRISGGGGFDVSAAFTGTGTVRFDTPAPFTLGLAATRDALKISKSGPVTLGTRLLPDNDAGNVIVHAAGATNGAGTTLSVTSDVQVAAPANSGAVFLASAQSTVRFSASASVQTLYPQSTGPLAGKLVSEKPLFLSSWGTFSFDPGFKAGRGTATNVTGGLSLLVYEGFGTLVTNHADNLPWVWKHDATGQPVQAGTIRFTSGDGMTWRPSGAAQSYPGRISVENNLNLVTLADLTHSGRVTPAGEHAFVMAGANRTITKSGPGTLRLDGDQGYDTGSTINVTFGGLRFGTDPGAGWLPGRYTRDALGNVAAPPAPAPNLSVTVSNASSRVTFAAPLVQLAGLSIGASARAAIEPPADPASQRTVHARTLTLASNAVFDVADQQFALDYTGTSPLPTVRAWILYAYAPNAASHWGGPGVTSSAAAGNPLFGLGYGEANALLDLSPGGTAEFAGATVDATTVLVRYARYGDADLDGVVNFADLVRLAQNYGTVAGAEWSRGDFDYNGSVDFADLVLIAQNYHTPTGPVPGNVAADWALASATVPEPTVFTPVLALLARRRRSRPRDN